MTYAAFNDELLAAGPWQVRANRRLSRLVMESAIIELTYCPQSPRNIWANREAFRRDLERRVIARCKASKHKGVMFTVVMVAILSAVVQFVVRRLLEWYFEDRDARLAMLWKFRGEWERRSA